MALKMNLRIITKNHAADPEIGVLTAKIFQAYGRTAASPTAWELNKQLILRSSINLRFGDLKGWPKFDVSYPSVTILINLRCLDWQLVTDFTFF